MSTIVQIVLWIALIGGMVSLGLILFAPFVLSSKQAAAEMREFAKPGLGLMEQDDE